MRLSVPSSIRPSVPLFSYKTSATASACAIACCFNVPAAPARAAADAPAAGLAVVAASVAGPLAPGIWVADVFDVVLAAEFG